MNSRLAGIIEDVTAKYSGVITSRGDEKWIAFFPKHAALAKTELDRWADVDTMGEGILIVSSLN